MLYPDRNDLPGHVPSDRIVDYDVFAVDAPDGDFAGAMVRLRDATPARLVWTQRNGGHWLVLDGECIRRILEQPDLFSSCAMRVPKAANPDPPMMPLMIDPPDHTIYRRLIAPAMTPAEVRRLEQRARELSIQLIEGFAPSGRCEFVSEFAQQMPIAVFMGMLDLPASDRPLIMDIVDRIVRPDVPETRMRGFAELGDYMLGKIAERRATPGDDFLSALAQAEVNGARLGDAELQGVTTVLMLAGLDTVAGMLTFIARFLADNPQHRADLRARPDITTRAIEEFLRRMAMVNLTREVVADTQIDDISLRVGDLIVLPTALCNFPEGGGIDRLDVDFDRPRQQHATFGAGPHFCLGSMLARAEVRIFLEEWLARIPDFTIEPSAKIEVKVGAAAAIPYLPLVWKPQPAKGIDRREQE